MQKFTGLDYIKIDIANSFGLDKKNWDVRLSWFNENKDNLDNLVAEADDPAMFFAGVLAYKDAMEDKEVQYPISLDATSSGIQLLSVLLCDEKAAKLCNVINVDGRRDIYTLIYHKILNKIGATDGSIDREDVKKSIMTSCYGATKKPKEIFGEKLYPIFTETMEEECSYIWRFNQYCLDIWDPTWESYAWIMPDNFHVNVKVEGTEEENLRVDKYTVVKVPYKVQKPQKSGRSIAANITHAVDSLVVREIVRRCMYNPDQIEYLSKVCFNMYKFGRIKHTTDRVRDNMLRCLWQRYQESGFLSARIFDYIDSYNVHMVDPKAVMRLIGSLPEKPFQVLPTHDCFRILPNYGNDVRQQYINMLAELHQSNVLQYIFTQIEQKQVKIKKLHDFTAQIYQSEYALS